MGDGSLLDVGDELRLSGLNLDLLYKVFVSHHLERHLKVLLDRGRNFQLILLPHGSTRKSHIFIHFIVVDLELRVLEFDPDGVIGELLCLDDGGKLQTGMLSAELRDTGEDGGCVVEGVLLGWVQLSDLEIQ